MSIKQNFIKVLQRIGIKIDYKSAIRINKIETIRDLFINISKEKFKFGGDAVDYSCSGRLRFYIEKDGTLIIYENDCNSMLKCRIAYIDVYINGNDDVTDPEIFIYSELDINKQEKVIRGIKYVKTGDEVYDENKVNEYLKRKDEYENGIINEQPESVRYVSILNINGMCCYINLNLEDVKPIEGRRLMPNRSLFLDERSKFDKFLVR